MGRRAAFAGRTGRLLVAALLLAAFLPGCAQWRRFQAGFGPDFLRGPLIQQLLSPDDITPDFLWADRATDSSSGRTPAAGPGGSPAASLGAGSGSSGGRCPT